MVTTLARPLTCVALALAALISGCSSGGGSGSGADGDLLDRLPSDARMVASVDLAKAREALGLPVGADPLEGDPENELRLVFIAGFALPHLQAPTPDPAREALDHGQIEAAVSGGEFGSQVTVVQTRQPVEEALDALEKEGYRRDGDVLASEKPAGRVSQIAYGAAGEADGLLVLASTREVLDEAIEGGGGADAPWRELLESVEGPLRLAVPSDGDCLQGLAGADSLKPAEGEIVVDPDGDPERSRASFLEDADEPSGRSLPGPFRGAEFDEAKVDGDLLRAPFSYDSNAPGPSPVGGLLGDVPASSFYDCG